MVLRLWHRGLGSATRAKNPALPVRLLAASANLPLVQLRNYQSPDCFGYRVPKRFYKETLDAEARQNLAENPGLSALINAYRSYGHLKASLDPLGIRDTGADAALPEAITGSDETMEELNRLLDPATYGLTDRQARFKLHGQVLMEETAGGEVLKEATLADIIAHMEKTYCGTLSVQYGHLSDPQAMRWWATNFERTWEKLTATDKRTVFDTLAKAEEFDHFMAKKFPNVKRYGAEGAETSVVALRGLLHGAALKSIDSVVLCMPHRGRLNVLTGLLGMQPRHVFRKCQGLPEYDTDAFPTGAGDVLSHLHTSCTVNYGTDGSVYVSFLPNPSHLETINPVAVGKTRSRQQYLAATKYRDDTECQPGDRVLCVQMHGDAAFAGQGVVTETLLLANLPHYTVGGSIHIVVNNQLGFTTPSNRARSSRYASDMARGIDAPVLHVNGDDPNKVMAAVRLALEYRATFHSDIIIDLWCYRRHGHNEMDEPSFTQPMMYNAIRNRTFTIPEHYGRVLVEEGLITDEEMQLIRSNHLEYLDEEAAKATKDAEAAKAQQAEDPWQAVKIKPTDDALSMYLQGHWGRMQHAGAPHLVGDVDDGDHAWDLDARLVGKDGAPAFQPAAVETGCDLDALKKWGELSVSVPESHAVHPRLQKGHVEDRLKKIRGQKAKKGSTEATPVVDWATAEAMAFASLLAEGYNVRLSGQDVGRGTFSQRHAMLVDQQTEKAVVPLNHNDLITGIVKHPKAAQGRLEIGNSPLSEYAVMGFEYGYSLEHPNALTLWEAQFGDFMNGAQIIIDTCISSGETKWLKQSGLVLLLPHGMDGTGPEHSSCRVERFLQLTDSSTRYFDAAGVNMHVVAPSTPAQYFHLLRRQMCRPYRKPLIVVGPKTMLRLPECQSQISALGTHASFHPVLLEGQDSHNGNAVVQANTDPMVTKVLYCSGKIFFDLMAQKQQRGDEVKDTAIVRVEELCPFPALQLRQVVQDCYPNARQHTWVQEEHANQGYWSFVEPRFRNLVGKSLSLVSREHSAVPAVGVGLHHRREVSLLFETAFGGLQEALPPVIQEQSAAATCARENRNGNGLVAGKGSHRLPKHRDHHYKDGPPPRAHYL
eukprot:Clim_evm15s143 gene=Clim_evmTU15s143